MSDDDKTKGVYEKYDVERTDGSSESGGKHQGCRYFVLDLDHDPHAEAALRAYAASCKGEYPVLAQELGYAADQIESAKLNEPPMVGGIDLGFVKGHAWA